MLAAIESVGCDPISEFAIAQNSLLHSDLLVAWNSRTAGGLVLAARDAADSMLVIEARLYR